MDNFNGLLLLRGCLFTKNESDNHRQCRIAGKLLNSKLFLLPCQHFIAHLQCEFIQQASSPMFEVGCESFSSRPVTFIFEND